MQVLHTKYGILSYITSKYCIKVARSFPTSITKNDTWYLVCFFIPAVPGRALIASRGRASEARREVGESYGVFDLRIPGHEVQVIDSCVPCCEARLA